MVNSASLVVIALCVGFGFAALLLRARNNRVAARWSRLERKWEQAVLDALEDTEAAADLQRSIVPDEIPYFVDFLTRFARRLRGVERDRVADLARPFLPEVRARLSSASPEVRARAVDMLGLLARRDSAGDLIAALDDPSLLVAMSAARALTRERSAEFAEHVVARLHRFQLWRPGFVAAMLAALGPEVAPILRVALADPRVPPWVRSVAAGALARLNDPDAGDVAAEVLAHASDSDLVAAALRVLAHVGRPEHLECIYRRLRAPEEAIRIAAVDALAALAGPHELPFLADALVDASPWVAEHAGRGLARGPGRPLLETIARSDAPHALVAREALAEVPG